MGNHITSEDVTMISERHLRETGDNLRAAYWLIESYMSTYLADGELFFLIRRLIS
jgi:hypothetical protein